MTFDRPSANSSDVQSERITQGHSATRPVLGAVCLIAAGALAWQLTNTALSGLHQDQSAQDPPTVAAERCLSPTERRALLFDDSETQAATDLPSAYGSHSASVIGGRVVDADASGATVQIRTADGFDPETEVLLFEDPFEPDAIRNTEFVALVEPIGSRKVVIPGGFFFACSDGDFVSNLSGVSPVTFGPTLKATRELADRVERGRLQVSAGAFGEDTAILDIGSGTPNGERIAIILPASVAFSRSPTSPTFTYVFDEWKSDGRIWNLLVANDRTRIRVGTSGCENGTAQEDGHLSICKEPFVMQIESAEGFDETQASHFDIVVVDAPLLTGNNYHAVQVFNDTFDPSVLPVSAGGGYVVVERNRVWAIDNAPLWSNDTFASNSLAAPIAVRVDRQSSTLVLFTWSDRGPSTPNTLTGINIETGTIVWAREVTTSPFAEETWLSRRTGPLVLGATDDDQRPGMETILEALDPATGATLWAVEPSDLPVRDELHRRQSLSITWYCGMCSSAGSEPWKVVNFSKEYLISRSFASFSAMIATAMRS